MECPYCGTELECVDFYGKIQYAENYWVYPLSWIEKEGDIYKCPNCEAFENEELALAYIEENDLRDETIETVSCDSGCFNGYFYTDKNGELNEGYPC